MNVVVTGPTGHVGGVLVRAILSQGRRVRAMIFVDGPALDGLDVEKVPGNVSDPASLRAAFEAADVVYHLAAVITLGRDRNGFARKVNVEGTRNVAEACRACGVRRLVHFSSIHALSPYPMHEPVTETRSLGFDAHLPAYDRTKAEAEAALLREVQNGLDAVIVNPTGIVGPYDFERSRMGRVVLDLCHRRMPSLVSGGFNWVDVRDVCQSALAAETRGTAGERYILGGNWHSVREVAAMVQSLTGVPAPRLVTPLWIAKAVAPLAELSGAMTGREPRFTRASLRALCHHQWIDSSKAERDLEHRPRPLIDTLRDTIDWFRAAGWVGEPRPAA